MEPDVYIPPGTYNASNISCEGCRRLQMRLNEQENHEQVVKILKAKMIPTDIMIRKFKDGKKLCIKLERQLKEAKLLNGNLKNDKLRDEQLSKDLFNQMNSYKEVNQVYCGKIEDLDKSSKNLKNKLKDRDQQVAALEYQMNGLKSSWDDLQTEKNDMKKELKKLRKIEIKYNKKMNNGDKEDDNENITSLKEDLIAKDLQIILLMQEKEDAKKRKLEKIFNSCITYEDHLSPLIDNYSTEEMMSEAEDESFINSVDPETSDDDDFNALCSLDDNSSTEEQALPCDATEYQQHAEINGEIVVENVKRETKEEDLPEKNANTSLIETQDLQYGDKTKPASSTPQVVKDAIVVEHSDDSTSIMQGGVEVIDNCISEESKLAISPEVSFCGDLIDDSSDSISTPINSESDIKSPSAIGVKNEKVQPRSTSLSADSTSVETNATCVDNPNIETTLTKAIPTALSTYLPTDITLDTPPKISTSQTFIQSHSTSPSSPHSTPKYPITNRSISSHISTPASLECTSVPSNFNTASPINSSTPNTTHVSPKSTSSLNSTPISSISSMSPNTTPALQNPTPASPNTTTPEPPNSPTLATTEHPLTTLEPSISTNSMNKQPTFTHTSPNSTPEPPNSPILANPDPTNSHSLAAPACSIPTNSTTTPATSTPTSPNSTPDPANSPSLATPEPTNSPPLANPDPANSPSLATPEPTNSPPLASHDPLNSPTLAVPELTNSPRLASHDPLNSPSLATIACPTSINSNTIHNTNTPYPANSPSLDTPELTNSPTLATTEPPNSPSLAAPACSISTNSTTTPATITPTSPNSPMSPNATHSPPNSPTLATAATSTITPTSPLVTPISSIVSSSSKANYTSPNDSHTSPNDTLPSPSAYPAPPNSNYAPSKSTHSHPIDSSITPIAATTTTSSSSDAPITTTCSDIDSHNQILHLNETTSPHIDVITKSTSVESMSCSAKSIQVLSNDATENNLMAISAQNATSDVDDDTSNTLVTTRMSQSGRIAAISSPSSKHNSLSQVPGGHRPAKPTTRVLPIPFSLPETSLIDDRQHVSRHTQTEPFVMADFNGDAHPLSRDNDDSGVFSPSDASDNSARGLEFAFTNFTSSIPENTRNSHGELSSDVKLMLIKTCPPSQLNLPSRKQFDRKLIGNLLTLLKEDGYSAFVEWIPIGSNLEIGVFRFNHLFNCPSKYSNEENTSLAKCYSPSKNENAMESGEIISDNTHFSDKIIRKRDISQRDCLNNSPNKAQTDTEVIYHSLQKEESVSNSDDSHNHNSEKLKEQKNIDKSKKISNIKKLYSMNFVKSNQQICTSPMKLEINNENNECSNEEIDFTSGIPLARENSIVPVYNEVNSNLKTSSNVFKWKDECNIVDMPILSKFNKNILRNNNSILNTPSLNANLTKKARKRNKKCKQRKQNAMKKLYNKKKTLDIKFEDKAFKIPDIDERAYNCMIKKNIDDLLDEMILLTRITRLDEDLEDKTNFELEESTDVNPIANDDILPEHIFDEMIVCNRVSPLLCQVPPRKRKANKVDCEQLADDLPDRPHQTFKRRKISPRVNNNGGDELSTLHASYPLHTSESMDLHENTSSSDISYEQYPSSIEQKNLLVVVEDSQRVVNWSECGMMDRADLPDTPDSPPREDVANDFQLIPGEVDMHNSPSQDIRGEGYISEYSSDDDIPLKFYISCAKKEAVENSINECDKITCADQENDKGYIQNHENPGDGNLRFVSNQISNVVKQYSPSSKRNCSKAIQDNYSTDEEPELCIDESSHCGVDNGKSTGEANETSNTLDDNKEVSTRAIGGLSCAENELEDKHISSNEDVDKTLLIKESICDQHGIDNSIDNGVAKIDNDDCVNTMRSQANNISSDEETPLYIDLDSLDPSKNSSANHTLTRYSDDENGISNEDCNNLVPEYSGNRDLDVCKRDSAEKSIEEDGNISGEDGELTNSDCEEYNDNGPVGVSSSNEDGELNDSDNDECNGESLHIKRSDPHYSTMQDNSEMMDMNICDDIQIYKDQGLNDEDIINILKLRDIPLQIIFYNIFKDLLNHEENIEGVNSNTDELHSDQELNCISIVISLSTSSKIIDSMHIGLSEILNFHSQNMSIHGIQSLSRFLTAICKIYGITDLIRVFIYDIMLYKVPNEAYFILSVARVWPQCIQFDLAKGNFLLSCIQIALARDIKKDNAFNAKFKDVLETSCEWTMDNWSDEIISSLINGQIKALFNGNNCPVLLSGITFGLKLLSDRFEWKWTKQALLDKHFIPFLDKFLDCLKFTSKLNDQAVILFPLITYIFKNKCSGIKNNWILKEIKKFIIYLHEVLNKKSFPENIHEIVIECLMELLEFKKIYIIETLLKSTLVYNSPANVNSDIRGRIVNLVKKNEALIKPNLLKKIKKSM